jgi:hypothetical protein
VNMRALPLALIALLGCSRRPPPPACDGKTGDVSLAAAFSERTRARVFISGHSLLESPIPEQLAELATAEHADYAYEYQLLFGSSLRARTKGDKDAPGFTGYATGRNRAGSNLDVAEELRQPKKLPSGDRYDTLIVTERHDITYVLWLEDTATYLRHLQDRFIAGNPQGRTFLYHPWLDLDKAAPATWIAHEKNALAGWECVASKVNQGLAAAGRADRVITLPAGLALVVLVEGVLAGPVPGIDGTPEARLSRIFSDDVHLTPLGSAYLALVLYSAVFGRSPEGAPPPAGVAHETAAALQRTAWRAVSAYYQGGNPRQRTMEECRCLMARTVCPSFSALDAATAHLRPPPPLKDRIKRRLKTLLGQPDPQAQCELIFGDPTNPANPFRND